MCPNNNKIHKIHKTQEKRKRLCNATFQTHPDSMRSGTPYGPFLVSNTAVPDASGRTGGY